MLKLLAFLVAVTSVNVFARPLSAHREIDTDYREYLSSRHIDSQFEREPTAYQSAVPLDKLDTSTLTNWENMETAQTGFERLRDFRFVFDDEHPTSLRRDSWLYPDDGCFARAALAKQNLKKWNFPAVKKIFAFGNLVVKTNNSPDGQVSWWYHVVTGISIGNQPYVLDPAIEPLHPLTLKEWVDHMGGEKASIALSICADGTYNPDDACENPPASADANAMVDQQEYLGAEWSRLEELQRDPVKELGDEPPWPLKYP